jgi:stage II sporulation protein D
MSAQSRRPTDAVCCAADCREFLPIRKSALCCFLSNLIFFMVSLLILSSFFLLSGCDKKNLRRDAAQMNTSPDFQVRVLLLKNATRINLRIDSAWTIAQNEDAQTFSLFGPTPSSLNISSSNGSFSVGEKYLSCTYLAITPQSPYIFNLNGRDYRGKLTLITNPDSNSFEVINIIPLEPYLAGVIGAEMPFYWEPAALEAQAICSRTYCLYIKRHFGASRNWDVAATQANQVYLGVSAETHSVWQAVNKTKGLVILSRRTDASFDILPAYFCSSCGGFTESSQAVFGGDYFESIQQVACPYCRLTARRDLFSWGNLSFDKSAVSRLLIQKYPSLENLGTIAAISPAKQTSFQIKNVDNTGSSELSRLTSLKLVGSSGSISFLRAEDFRLAIDPAGTTFKSTLCKISDAGGKWLITGGRGFGHGCGLCQCGCEAMARFESKTAEQILSYYYPNSRIAYVY